MTEFNISKIRYNWKGAWNSGTEYKIDDVVQNGGSSFVCVVKHTASELFDSDINNMDTENNILTPYWIKMTDGYSWRDQWENNSVYDVGDIVLSGGTVYICVEAHVSDNLFSTNASKWNVFAAQISFKQEWSPSTLYAINDVIRYGGIVYICSIEHTSSDVQGGLEFDQEKWTVYYLGYEYKGQWQVNTQYKTNDLVKFGGSLYSAKQQHTTSSDSSINFDKDLWELVAVGYQFRGEWTNDITYRIGDVVRHGGWLFYSLTDNFNDSPASSLYLIENRTDPVAWKIISKGINFRGNWNVNTNYKTGDLVIKGGNVYVALLDTEITSDGSSLGYLDDSNWELISTGQNFKSEWKTDTDYSVGDVVVFQGTSYICKLGHASSNNNFPAIDIASAGTGFQFWDILVQSGSEAGLRYRGDILTFDLLRGFYGDDSSLGVSNVSAGTNGQLLSIDDNSSVVYKTYSEVDRVFYVSLDGIDSDEDPQQGVTPFKPWRTIRYACEKADDGFAGTTTVRVKTGKFEEILPIIVPKNTAIVGDELRSTTVSANSRNNSLLIDRSVYNNSLTRISQLIQSIIAGTNLSVPKTPANPLNPVVLTDTLVTESVDEFFNPILTETEVVIETSPQAAIDIQQLIVNIQNYINFYIIGTGVKPNTVGTNQQRLDTGYVNAVRVLQANKEFLIAEVLAHTSSVSPNYQYDQETRKKDIGRLIDAWSYDLIFTGNYKSLLEARYYSNRTIGSKLEDMFYFRDGSGMRNLTVSGLEGILNPSTITSILRFPTGGAYASLDPGWGPDDNRAWIINRSPYIQNVTTIGKGCVGQKIDGALHNGGNRSMVSNDFTQVIDDGIGAYVLNQGRAELVSVFSYYAHIGYLAANGGIIRSTNGNNSYGTFGAVADGNDETEIPQTAVVNNRNQSANANVFAGDFTDEIQILEWFNAGQEYTQATASFVGAGSGANVKFEEFRDEAVHTVEIVDSSTDAIQRIGGGGYIRIQNSAQVHQVPNGDLTSITISANDQNTDAEYLGCRIILTSGPGTGQYGYITGYNTGTKIVTVARESDDQPGWDHVIPGTPVAPTLTSSTLYRIEPRPIFDAPPFISEEYNTSLSTAWGSIVYGETTEVFENLEGEPGTGEVEDQDGLSPVTATFTITKTGRSYSVAVVDSGAGYKVNDEILISGELLGGITPTNDLIITVIEISNDSTNSIIDFTVDGVGASGRFIALTENGSAGQASMDGATWNEQFNMPSSGNWTVLGSGNNKFVALRANSNQAATSLSGISWTAKTLPVSAQWNSIVYGDNKFIAIAKNQSIAIYSNNDGESWTETELPTIGDSSYPEWVDIAYGRNRFVIISNSQNIAGYSDDGINWTGIDLYNDSSTTPDDWTGIAYGNNRFVALASNGKVLYSFDAELWLNAELPDLGSDVVWGKLKYAQGVFFALAKSNNGSATDIAATSFDGIVWTVRQLASTANWRGLTFGNPYIELLDSTVGKNTPVWVSIDNTNIVNRTRTGARALGRVDVSAGVISEVKLWDTGSGYPNEPKLTLISPTATSNAVFQARVADGVLTNPTWLNRGLGYRTGTTIVTISGNGFSDEIPRGKFVTLSNFSRIPAPGAQLFFAGNPTRYTVVTIQPLNGMLNGGNGARLRITPELRIRDNLQNGTGVILREKYSQVRITGHDFLDIGTGNFAQTNYPELYSGLFFSAPEDEVRELNGGRVFYTSTDQSGNFRTGKLFAVEQATGIVTISADFFDLGGLSEIRLGGIRVGGAGAVIREFSTDPTFSEDSNNIVPTQRAIAAFLSSRLSLGGSEVATFEVQAGQVKIGGPDIISNPLGLKILFPGVANFSGTNAGISGAMLAQNMFYKSFN
jgi:hypothetical protein